ncbi:MAG: RsiV family protein [Pyrinomonadaceae bacterium]
MVNLNRIILLSTFLTILFVVPDKLEAQDNVLDCVRSGRDFQAGGIKIVSAKLRRKGDFKYPQITAPRTPQQRKFNADVLKIVRRDLAGDGNWEGYGFSASFVTPEFVSVQLWISFCGASCHVGITALNFDLKTGKRINKLSELFKPKSNYLKTIASYSVGELKRCPRDDLDLDEEWFKEGTKPTANNYNLWSLTRDGVAITFPEYQIAPGVFPGIDVVVPYSHLQAMLRQDIEWFRRLKDSGPIEFVRKDILTGECTKIETGEVVPCPDQRGSKPLAVPPGTKPPTNAQPTPTPKPYSSPAAY